jgi:hypothetical protein
MADPNEFSAAPVIKINAFAAWIGTTVILMSLFVPPHMALIQRLGAAVILILGQIVQAWGAVKERRLGGVLLKDGTLVHGGVSIALVDIASVERTRSGLILTLRDGTRAGIPSFVYAARDLHELRNRIAKSRSANQSTDAR